MTVFFRRFPLLSALPSEDVVGGLVLPSEGGAEGIMNVQFEIDVAEELLAVMVVLLLDVCGLASAVGQHVVRVLFRFLHPLIVL